MERSRPLPNASGAKNIRTYSRIRTFDTPPRDTPVAFRNTKIAGVRESKIGEKHESYWSTKKTCFASWRRLKPPSYNQLSFTRKRVSRGRVLDTSPTHNRKSEKYVEAKLVNTTIFHERKKSYFLIASTTPKSLKCQTTNLNTQPFLAVPLTKLNDGNPRRYQRRASTHGRHLLLLLLLLVCREP